MTQELALTARTGKKTLETVRQQLKDTQELIRKTKELALAAGTPKDFYIIAGEQPEATEKPSKLMGLPYDARHEILEHLVGTQNIRVFVRGDRIPICLPEAARAGSTDLRRECLLVALKKRTFEIHDGRGNASFQKWLSKIEFTSTDSFCETGFDVVTSLYFPYFSRFLWRVYKWPNPKNNDIGLALLCKNLRSLTIKFHDNELRRIARKDPWFFDAAEVARDIRKYSQLDGLLNAAKLENLHFETSHHEDYSKGLALVRKELRGVQAEGRRQGDQYLSMNHGLSKAQSCIGKPHASTLWAGGKGTGISFVQALVSGFRRHNWLL
jgi:hypothetical protein